ncbi:ribosome maturation factor RimP [Facilibium subflavum]|uniref:ribosome maturation factor RimP n=1 Tax=Facilibium subflavum TaxID=2219058 RepID=UPI000E65155D|nr:ribosome maturation factor RimP [Facilibium subflavum]
MLIEQLSALIAPEVEDLGFIFWGLEIDGAGQHEGVMTVRIFIDYEEGISVDDCQKVSHAVSAVLDVEDPIHRAYVLEVSSPGMNRRVFNAIQAKSLEGFMVKVQLFEALEGGRRRFKGVIESVVDEQVCLKTEEGEVSFSFDNVEKMRVVPQF